MSFAVQAPQSDDDLPFAAAMFSFFRSLGQTLGVAIGGVVFQNALKWKIAHDPVLSIYGKAEEWSKDASAMVEVIRNLPAAQIHLKNGLIGVYMDSLKGLWIVMATFACLATVVCWLFTDETSLDRELVTEQGFRDGTVHDVEKRAKSVKWYKPNSFGERHRKPPVAHMWTKK